MASAAQKSRFWGGESDGSESDGSDSSSKSSGAAEGAGKPVAAARGAGRFAVESDSESEEENRVAKSVKDRTWEGLQAIIKAVNNHLKINSWVSLQEGEAGGERARSRRARRDYAG
jgi:hypothetical protein